MSSQNLQRLLAIADYSVIMFQVSPFVFSRACNKVEQLARYSQRLCLVEILSQTKPVLSQDDLSENAAAVIISLMALVYVKFMLDN